MLLATVEHFNRALTLTRSCLLCCAVCLQVAVKKEVEEEEDEDAKPLSLLASTKMAVVGCWDNTL